jgi:hypothetical protein
MNSEYEQIVYVTGGRQRRAAAEGGEWHAYAEAVVLKLKLDSHEVETVFTYKSPPEACSGHRPSFVFKSGSLLGDALVLCTQTEVFTLDPDTTRISEYVSLPCFNDVHHVLALGKGHYVIANTGLDMILEVLADGTVGREWSALGIDVWSRFSTEIDYRKVASTKPHLAHPNYVFILDDEIWATRFEQEDAICLTRNMPPIEIGAGKPHDGLLSCGAIYFTTVNGRVVEVDADTRRIRRTIDLNAIEATGEPLGWCRGLFVTDATAWVGFSRFRQTRLRRNLSWVKHGFNVVGIHRTRATRLSAYDLQRNRLLDEIDLEPYGLNAIFSILPARG